MANRPHQMQVVATPVKLTARAALRLQACTNAVELAIIANSIALDSALKAVCMQECTTAPNDDAWKRTTERTLSVP